MDTQVNAPNRQRTPPKKTGIKFRVNLQSQSPDKIKNYNSSAFNYTAQKGGKQGLTNNYQKPQLNIQRTISDTRGQDSEGYKLNTLPTPNFNSGKVDWNKNNLNFNKSSSGEDESHYNSNAKNYIPLRKNNNKPQKEYIKRRVVTQKPMPPRNDSPGQQVRNRMVYIRKDRTRKRNPSINNIMKQNPKNISQTKQRSKSESYKVGRTAKGFDSTFGQQKDLIPYIKTSAATLPPFDRATVSLKNYGPIDAFAVNTHKGYVRVHNEDRVSILLNAQKQFKKIDNKNTLLNCSIFSVFDGHGGSACSNFLKNHLHNSLIEELDVEGLMIPSLKEIYQTLDEEFINKAVIDRNVSGSTANTVMVFNNRIVVANVGDSRCIFSSHKGAQVIEGSKDHKPGSITEFNRIVNRGGELYRMSYNTKTGQNKFYFVSNHGQLTTINDIVRVSPQLMFGPWRIKPGGLSVSRGFGDIESKASKFGGNANIVVSEPDIFDYELEGLDFCVLGCKLIS